MKNNKPTKTSNYHLLFIFSSLFILGGAFTFKYSYTTTYMEFPNYEVAEEKMQIGSVLPIFLAPSAEKIKVSMNVDTNERLVSFIYHNKDKYFMEEYCTESDHVILPNTSIHKKAGWWPKFLNEESNDKSHNAGDYKFYSCDNSVSKISNHLAIIDNGRENTAYFWTISQIR